MFNSVLAVKTQPHGIVDPKNVLNFAYSNTKAEGASTTCIITLRHKSLHAVNIGDSGFRIYKGHKCIYRSPVQHRGFNNCPYHLGNAVKCDSPSLAEVLEVPIEVGDIVVAGTDGLFDNIFDSEIEEQLKKGIEYGLGAPDMACYLADLVLYNSFDRYTLSPYGLKAQQSRIKHQGGKIDDITVIVSYMLCVQTFRIITSSL
ncbi:phosphatase PTC7-like protein [Thalictrum thalictroides]|uniref:Protein phosphatase n=1 Tax=Thalictrum thalictroides TaxID=46969 RepID=A0A7J6VUS2_THATH|nr:phosphatase PTC7-like protein [Thalictrum thalictroides]